MLFYSLATNEAGPTGVKELICPIRTLKAFLLPKESIGDLDVSCSNKPGVIILYGKGQTDSGFVLPAIESVQEAFERAQELSNESWNKCLIFVEKSEQDTAFTPDRIMMLSQNLVKKAGFEDVFRVMDNKYKTTQMETMLSEAFAEEIIAVTQMLGMSLFDSKGMDIKPVGLMAAMRSSNSAAEQIIEGDVFDFEDVSRKTKERIKSKIEKEPGNKAAEGEKYSHFRVNKGSIREFTNWRNLLVEYSKIIIKKKGLSTFKEKVFNCPELAGPVFDNKKPDQLPRTQYYEFTSSLYCWLDKPAKQYEQPVKTLQQVFPDMALKLIANENAKS